MSKISLQNILKKTFNKKKKVSKKKVIRKKVTKSKIIQKYKKELEQLYKT